MDAVTEVAIVLLGSRERVYFLLQSRPIKITTKDDRGSVLAALLPVEKFSGTRHKTIF